ncbi:hypothetical protein SLS58_003702 [Diplodia intermedia]|uniref:Zn(2)-C6 fungal-type domain-containing protein n=1 Tax=Diplodia intermedia TaxID=856260 RepID=A0ABR3TVX1_9PEZI
MVGVPKSKGCATCRLRKIRCDENWPVCQQCRRSRRECPGPSNPHGKFMDEGPRQRARQTTIRTAVAPSERPTQHHVQKPPCTDIETVRTKLTTSGAMFSTMKIVSDDQQGEPTPAKHQRAQLPSPPDARARKQLQRQRGVFGGLPQPLPLSGVEILTSRLVATLNEAGPSNQIKLFGPFIGEVPRRLGSTTALNDATACLTTTHDAIIRKHSKTTINPQLYAKALKSLHAAIQDPVQVKSTSTLCATVLLAITEAYATGICGTNRNFITHLGGAARILELRGPDEFQNPSSFERALLRAITVGVGLDAIFTGKEDILATREWQAVAFDTTGVTEPRASMFRISRTLSLLPSLTRDVRAHLANSSSSVSASTRLSLLRRAESLHRMLDEVKPYIDATLADPQRVQRVAAAPEHAHLWPEAYRFADAGVAFVLWFFWNMRMISSSIIRDIRRMARSVCMSWEHARAVRPLGAMYIDVGLIVAHSVYAGAPERQRWVLRALEELTEGSSSGSSHSGGGGGRPAGEGVIAGRMFERNGGVGGSTNNNNNDWSAERVGWLGKWFTAGCVDYVGGGGEEEEGEEGDAGSGSLLFEGYGAVGGDGGSGGYVESVMTASPTTLMGEDGVGGGTSPEFSSSLWDEWAFTAAAGGQDFVDWDASMSSSDGMSFRADSAYGSGGVGADGEPVASRASTATVTDTTAGRAWSPDSLDSSLADTDSFLVLQPMGVRVRWPTTMTTMTPTNNGRDYGFDNFNSFGSTLNTRPFVA